MKKIKKYLSIIIAFSVGLIISFFGTTYAASQILASNVDFSPSDISWNVTNAEAAINDLYYKVPGVPTGTILPFMGKTAPTGYMICDGTEYNISSHTNLANFIKEEFGSINYFGGDGETTFKVPDLRGEFLRGSGTATRNTGTGAEVGVHQNGTEQPHIFASVRKSGSGAYLDFGYNSSNITYSDTSYNYSSFINPDTYKGRTANLAVSASIENLSTSSWGSYTSRPTNTAVLYIIKY